MFRAIAVLLSPLTLAVLALPSGAQSTPANPGQEVEALGNAASLQGVVPQTIQNQSQPLVLRDHTTTLAPQADTTPFNIVNMLGLGDRLQVSDLAPKRNASVSVLPENTSEGNHGFQVLYRLDR